MPRTFTADVSGAPNLHRDDRGRWSIEIISGGMLIHERTTLAAMIERYGDAWPELRAARPAHRPRRDPAAARINLVVRVHPDTRSRIAAEARRTGESQGQVVDRLASALPLHWTVSG